MTTVYQHHRPQLRRNSPLSMFRNSQGFAANAPMLQDIAIDNDSSSEDELPQPMKFSALTNALLASESRPARSTSNTPSQLRILRPASPAIPKQSPRIVRVSSRASTLQSPDPSHHPNYHYTTPAPPTRAFRLNRQRAGSNDSLSRSGGTSASGFTSTKGARYDSHFDPADDHPSAERASNRSDAGTQYLPASTARPKVAFAEHPAVPSSQMRIKRVHIGPGSLLRTAPVRRGFKQRDSDVTADQHDESLPVLRDEQVLGDVDQNKPLPDPPAPSIPIADVAEDSAMKQLAQRPSRASSMHQIKPAFGKTVAQDDQENMPPPTFQRNKEHAFAVFGKPERVIVSDLEKNRSFADTPVRTSKQATPRKILGPLSENTPHRPAPHAPPKMSVLDAATKSAGAETTKSRKRRQHVVINGKTFTQLKRLGTGGSAQVFCVMAENTKMFALKKVKLGPELNDSALAGFLGEIELLQQFKDSNRVVQLYEHELDSSKQHLSLLMEMGDHDLNKILNSPARDARLDTVMIRYYWKEMLECVQAVHEHDIVHSDLKPANFLSVRGRLKLIDFGIANAIDIEHTVNVHRNDMIGTPNYMSPESFDNVNSARPGVERTKIDTKTGRVMKIGKPSDVWSLGCVLYQMTYGSPPFAHIPNQFSRVMAITNNDVEIAFPPTSDANGNSPSPVPASLINTLRKCLQRDPQARPTVEDLLDPSDRWLYPDDNGAVAMSEDLLGKIIGHVVKKCRDSFKQGHELTQEEVGQYPAAFMKQVRDMVAMAGLGVVRA